MEMPTLLTAAHGLFCSIRCDILHRANFTFDILQRYRQIARIGFFDERRQDSLALQVRMIKSSIFHFTDRVLGFTRGFIIALLTGLLIGSRVFFTLFDNGLAVFRRDLLPCMDKANLLACLVVVDCAAWNTVQMGNIRTACLATLLTLKRHGMPLTIHFRTAFKGKASFTH